MENEGTSGPTHSTGVRRGEDIKEEDGKERDVKIRERRMQIDRRARQPRVTPP